MALDPAGVETPQTFLWEADGGILSVTLTRPDRLNALSSPLQSELAAFWAQVRDEPELRCVIVTGAGRAFSAGADTADLSSGSRPDATIGVHAVRFFPGGGLGGPVIVAINGMCVGGALNFLADADIAL